MVGTRRRAAAAAQQAGLLAAVQADDLDAVQQALAQSGAQWESEGGLTALHMAAGFAGGAVLAALLQAAAAAGCAVDAVLTSDYTSPDALHPLLTEANDETRLAYRSGATALHIAVYFGDEEAVGLLLAAGASPNIPDATGATAMHYCTCNPLAPTNRQQPKRSAAKVHADIPRMLLAAGGNIFTDSTGFYYSAPLFQNRSRMFSRSAGIAFLLHAVQEYDAGRWAAEGLYMHDTVMRAVDLRCKPFFARFWRHLRSINASKLQMAAQMGCLEAARELLEAGTSASGDGAAYFMPLVTAVRNSDSAMVQLLLQHGAQASGAAVLAALSGMPKPGILRQLLATGVPAVAPMSSVASYWSGLMWTCPVLLLLSLSGSERRVDPPRDAQYRKAAAECMEILAEAGCKPTVYTNVRTSVFDNTVAPSYDPLQQASHLFQVHATNKWLWMAYQRPKWTPAAHNDQPQAFRQAVRALLLAAHRDSSGHHGPGRHGDRSAAASLGQVPAEVLLHIVAAAAHPMSAWL